MSEKIQVVYDGKCPFCTNYCQMVRLKKAAGEIELVDARDPSPIMEEINAKGLDIDQGMVVKMNGKLYYGSNAIHILSLLSSRSGFFNRLNYRLFKSRTAARILYPFLRECRNLALWVMNVPLIDNLDKGKKSWFDRG